MQGFRSAEWIWHAAPAGVDEYADFLADFELPAGADAPRLRLAADTNYTVWLNGELAAFGQYADYPDYKVYDDVALPGARSGRNRLAVQVWYYGIDTQTYRIGEAAVVFEVVSGDAVLAASGTATLSRLAVDYVSHRGELISTQLGPNYHYDAAHADDWRGLDAAPAGFAPSRAVPGVSRDFHPRPNEKIVLGARCPSKLVQQGVFREALPADKPTAERIQAAYLGLCPQPMTFGHRRAPDGPTTLRAGDGDDGVYVIYDLRREEAGFLDLDFDVPADCDVDVGYGEHLSEGRCRTAVRCYSADYHARAGANVWMNTFRRFGCRYLQLHFHSPEVTIRYIGLRPTDYPLEVKPFDAGNPLRQAIYDTCLRTLLLCLHEHYEDCPSREQALYTMDSRNQMLCGYYAFGETRAARASLELMTHGLRADGLMNLCFPAGMDFPIPFFSLMYFIQMREYMDRSGDETLARDNLGLLAALMRLFLDRRDETGLCPNFLGDKHWNFYEWQPTMTGKLNAQDEFSHDAPLNGFLSLALDNYAAIQRRLGYGADADAAEAARREVNAALPALFNAEVGLFETYDTKCRGQYSVLTNSLMLLCGAADGLDTSFIERILAVNGEGDFGVPVIPSTLSMNCFRFDALLRRDRECFAPVILDEIDRVYLMMLQHGATTFWETFNGDADFGNAGSLCHGWSALPVYYYHVLGAGK